MRGPLGNLLITGGLVIFLFGSVCVAYVAGSVVEARLLAVDARHIVAEVNAVYGQHVAGGRVPDETLRELGDRVMTLAGVFRVKVWAPDGRILWSNEPKLIGRVFTDNASLGRAARGEVIASVVKTIKTEHEYERSTRRAREIYVPVGGTPGRAGLIIEPYLDATALEREVRSAQLTLAGVSGAAGLILYALLAIAVWRASVTLAAARERERGEMEARLRLVERLRAFGEVAAGAIHDLGNVFTIISGRLQMLRLSGALPPETSEKLRIAEKAAEDGIEIMDRLRHIGRQDDRRALGTLCVKKLAGEVLRLTEPRWRRCHGVDVIAEVDSAASVIGRASELREVMTNLVLNALDAMPRGGRLTIATSVEDGEVRLVVADTGVGMSDAVRRRLFVPFTTTKPNGTGLGLSVSYGIVKRHGGTIDVESAEGAGSRFVVRLPEADPPMCSGATVDCGVCRFAGTLRGTTPAVGE